MTHLFTKWTVLAVCAPGLGDGRTFDRDAFAGGGAGSLRQLLSVYLRMKEKTTPAAPFRHNLGSRSTALFLGGQKPDAVCSTLSFK